MNASVATTLARPSESRRACRGDGTCNGARPRDVSHDLLRSGADDAQVPRLLSRDALCRRRAATAAPVAGKE